MPVKTGTRRQPTPQLKQIITGLPQSLVDQIEEIAAERNISRAYLIREAVEAYIDRTQTKPI